MGDFRRMGVGNSVEGRRALHILGFIIYIYSDEASSVKRDRGEEQQAVFRKPQAG